MKRITRDHIERTSMRILAKRHGTNKRRVMETVHAVTAAMKGSVWLAKRFQPSWSGILAVDGKYVRVFDKLTHKIDPSAMSALERHWRNKKSWLCCIDCGTGDLPHYELADEETMVDLVLFMKALKEEIRYVLRVLVCDGNDHIVRAARKVYGSAFLVQRCTIHYLKGVRRKCQEAGIADSSEAQSFLALIQGIIQTDSLEKSFERLKALRRKRPGHPVLKKLWKTFLDDDVVTLTTYLQYPELCIPHTSNDIENLMRQVNIRLKTIGSFQHWRYAREYLKAWALWRRCTPFTDAKGKRRYRNGKAPLELAGCSLKNIDYFDL